MEAVQNEPMKVERVPMSSLRLDDRNARKGNVAAIADSLRELGQHRPLVIQRGTNKILVGNHTYKAAQALGWTEIDVYYVDDDDIKALRRSLADNRTGDLATWDKLELAQLVQEAGENIPGFDADFIDSLSATLDMDLDKEKEPIYPIAARFDEKYDYVVIFAKNATDWAFLETILELETKKSFKNKAVGICRVLTVQEFAQRWRGRSNTASPSTLELLEQEKIDGTEESGTSGSV